MTISVTHATVVVVPDDGTSPVGTDEWNAGHTVTGAAALTSNTFTGAQTISDTTASTTTGTGALIVAGGVGVGGNINTGGTITATATPVANGTLNLSGGDSHASTTNATISLGFSNTNNYRHWIHTRHNNVAAQNAIEFYTNDGSDGIFPTNGVIGLTIENGALFGTNLSLSGTTASTNTTTGALTVAGGVGVAGALSVGGTVTVPPGSVIAGGSPSLTFSSNNTTGFSADAQNLAFWESGRIALDLATVIAQFRVPADFSLSWSSLTNNNSAADAGLGRNAAGVVEVNNGTVGGAGALKVNATTASTSATTGALAVAGGAGIALDLFVGGGVSTGTVAVASLPAAAAGNKGMRMMVSNATATTFWSIVAAGGANIVPVTSDGTNWRIG